MVEPQLLEPQLSAPTTQVSRSAKVSTVRLLETQASGHIGRIVLHRQPNGELAEDAVRRWSSAPDRYLDTALRLEAASSPDVLLVETGRSPTLAATILVWDLESAEGTQLVGVVEFEVTGTDRVVHTHVVRNSEPVSAELPGDLANAAGRLLRRLASAGFACVASES